MMDSTGREDASEILPEKQIYNLHERNSAFLFKVQVLESDPLEHYGAALNLMGSSDGSLSSWTNYKVSYPTPLEIYIIMLLLRKAWICNHRLNVIDC
jgi:hypothetical protein